MRPWHGRHRVCWNEMGLSSDLNIALRLHGIQLKRFSNIMSTKSNPEQWILFLEARNKTSHLYHPEVAEELFKRVPVFLICCHQLYSTLQMQLK
ncbi:MAG TPA: hypothetical protein DCY86_02830 [Bdellovibrionales bacterium]|nr:hypothetical protein [Bdellovibrionales bacterium]